jgi:hypothetical protein
MYKKTDDKVKILDLSVAIAMEARRLAEKYQKDTFECSDLPQILNVGNDNARSLMNSEDFPSIRIGGRVVVPALALAAWMVKEYKIA